ncbi:D-amino-acid transaminase [Roseospira marina]|uniref:Probable branched-chain-amino-acid aminotransferase n=1 Tax=Roseospira marina TaxID=140057 RepID=A0A5M6IGF4_9PROT|nr:D-amino-acid transaminase [Roseospira marina]KAA5607304.1 D-amino-acid transaminase [Roseospira marina]MBB4312538.1 D-alanine transaminase [Roseospira marina]MBB5085446.1 D-alanine transaminase [Roseospira marina]
MSRVAYVNGRYQPHAVAAVHIEDRGMQFSDGIYEVVAVVDGHPIDLSGHIARLDRSLTEMRIARPMPSRSLRLVMRELVRRNRLSNGIVYIQVNRGVYRRDHPFPPAHVAPSLVMTVRSGVGPSRTAIENGVPVITMPDRRWARRDIKSVSLLPNVLAKEAAHEAGAWEAWQVDRDGYITEGASTNAWIVSRDGALVTRPLNDDILAGITRQSLLALARADGMTVEERPFTVEEAKAAREAFTSSTTLSALPVVRIDDAVVANGVPGSLTRRLRELYAAHIAGAGREDWLPE